MPSPRAYASRWASPISRIAPSASDEAPVCSAMNRHSANRSTETPSASACAATSASPLATPTSAADASAKARRRAEPNAAAFSKEDLSEIPSTSNPSLVSICSPATAITHVPFLSPP